MGDRSLPTGPVVTVLMPAYNAARYLCDAVDSVLAQHFVDFELLVIDDGSSDDTPAIMASITDPRVRYVRHDRNRGLVAVLNEGLDTARGTYIARMDADDVMHPQRLGKQVHFLEQHPTVAVVASFVDLINADGAITGGWSTDRGTVDEAGIRAMMPRTNCIAHPSVMLVRRLLGDLRYAPDQQGAEDWDLWMRLLARGARIAKLAEPLLRYRMHLGSVMAGTKRQETLERRLWRTRTRFLFREWAHGRISPFHLAVLKAQARTFGGMVLREWLPQAARSAFRLLTYSPFRMMAEERRLKEALATWQGRHAFVFSYLNTGGAEQVHDDIMATVQDQDPIIFVTGFSKDRGFADRFAQRGTLVEIPRLLHHPFTARTARRRIVEAITAKKEPVLFGANTDHFALWLSDLGPSVRGIHLIHAFLHQAEGNTKHKEWLPLFGHTYRYVFVARHALDQFKAFLFANNVVGAEEKLILIPNAVHAFGTVTDHERPGLLFVGRDSPEKRPELFVRLAGTIHARHPGRFRTTMVGTDAQHPLVRSLGTINDAARLAAVYAEHDVLVVTSTREGFPMVIMEAMAHGLGVMATPVGDVPARVHAPFGVVTSSVDADAVVQEMGAALEALAADPERLSAMRRSALEEAQRRFGMERFRASYRELLISPKATS